MIRFFLLLFVTVNVSFCQLLNFHGQLRYSVDTLLSIPYSLLVEKKHPDPPDFQASSCEFLVHDSLNIFLLNPYSKKVFRFDRTGNVKSVSELQDEPIAIGYHSGSFLAFDGSAIHLYSSQTLEKHETIPIKPFKKNPIKVADGTRFVGRFLIIANAKIALKEKRVVSYEERLWNIFDLESRRLSEKLFDYKAPQIPFCPSCSSTGINELLFTHNDTTTATVYMGESMEYVVFNRSPVMVPDSSEF
ncbi:hypothetical protein ACFL5S_02195, partial [Fibrobacterota bacterium]